MTVRRLNAALIFSLLIALFLAAGCGSKSTAPLAPDAVKNEIVGKEWVCEKLFIRDLSEEAGVTIKFSEDGIVSGTSGCNNFTGKYTITGSALSFGPLVTTKKACGPVASELEYTFLTYLSRMNKAVVEDDELMLFTNEVPKPMVFVEKD